jgi:hypothetical protein
MWREGASMLTSKILWVRLDGLSRPDERSAESARSASSA